VTAIPQTPPSGPIGFNLCRPFAFVPAIRTPKGEEREVVPVGFSRRFNGDLLGNVGVTWALSALPAAAPGTSVTITFKAKGDFDFADEFLRVTFGTATGDLLLADTGSFHFRFNGLSCAGESSDKSTIPAEIFNSRLAAGQQNLTLVMVPSSAVGSCGGFGYIQVSLDYFEEQITPAEEGPTGVGWVSRSPILVNGDPVYVRGEVRYDPSRASLVLVHRERGRLVRCGAIAAPVDENGEPPEGHAGHACTEMIGTQDLRGAIVTFRTSGSGCPSI